MVLAWGTESYPSCSHSSHKTHGTQDCQEQWEGIPPQVLGITLRCTTMHHGWEYTSKTWARAKEWPEAFSILRGSLSTRNAQLLQRIEPGIWAHGDKKVRRRKYHWDSGRELEPCTPEPRRLCPVSGLLTRPRTSQLASPPERASQQRQTQPNIPYSATGNVFCSMVVLLRPMTECCKNNNNNYDDTIVARAYWTLKMCQFCANNFKCVFSVESHDKLTKHYVISQTANLRIREVR